MHTRCPPTVRAETVIIRHGSFSDEAGCVLDRSARAVVDGPLGLEREAAAADRGEFGPRVLFRTCRILHDGHVG